MSRFMSAFLEDLTKSRTAMPLGSQLRHREATGRTNWIQTPAQPMPALVEEAAAPQVEAPVDMEALKDAARMEGEREGLKAAQMKIEALAQRYVDAIERLEKATQDCAKPSANEIVDLALATAAELVGHELSVNRDVIADTVASAVEAIEERRGIIVRLGKADLAYLTQRRPELLSSGGYFVEDDSLGIGGCVIETQQKIMDLSVGRRLEAVRDSLRDVLSPPEGVDVGAETVEIES